MENIKDIYKNLKGDLISKNKILEGSINDDLLDFSEYHYNLGMIMGCDIILDDFEDLNDETVKQLEDQVINLQNIKYSDYLDLDQKIIIENNKGLIDILNDFLEEFKSQNLELNI